MSDRRRFLQASLIAGVESARFLFGMHPSALGFDSGPGVPYRLDRVVSARLFDGERCWCHPRAGIVPGAGKDGVPRVVMTMNTLDLSGSDVFKAMYVQRTDDLGETWTAPVESSGLALRHEDIEGRTRPVAVSDFWPRYHAVTGRLLGTGHTVVYTPDWKVASERPRHTAYSVYDPGRDQWSAWRKLAMPDPAVFANCGAGSTQRFDLPDGTVLLPVYFRPPGRNSRVTVLQCSFDGRTLAYRSHGDVLAVEDDTRGIGEPSLTRFEGAFFLTIRHDRRAYVTRSEDGLQFEPLREWRFDDGQELGSYNTQAHWVTHGEGLFLVYTRRGANNDHVFRHRAPLFMAQVDPRRLCVIRDTERILVPERGARLGNFGVVDVTPDETWVTVAEWMQPKGVERYGSDGSVFVARIHWVRSNRLFPGG